MKAVTLGLVLLACVPVSAANERSMRTGQSFQRRQMYQQYLAWQWSQHTRAQTRPNSTLHQWRENSAEGWKATRFRMPVQITPHGVYTPDPIGGGYFHRPYPLYLTPSLRTDVVRPRRR